MTREPLSCCRVEGLEASGGGWLERALLIDKYLPQGLGRPAGGCPSPSSRNSQAPSQVEWAGNYLSASSVPHNWLFFANSLLGWECTKSLEGAWSHHKRLPEIKRPPPRCKIISSGSPALPVPSARSLAPWPSSSQQGSRTSSPYLSPPPFLPPPRRGGNTAETPCNSGCHWPNYAPWSSPA